LVKLEGVIVKEIKTDETDDTWLGEIQKKKNKMQQTVLDELLIEVATHEEKPDKYSFMRFMRLPRFCIVSYRNKTR
jgi:hypothetical protein